MTAKSKRNWRHNLITVPVTLTGGQMVAIESLVSSGRYGSSGSEVIRYLITRGLQEFHCAGCFDAIDAGIKK